MIYLKDLPREHTLRNTPLKEIKAQIRNVHGTRWRSVATWKIGKMCFNDLWPVWLETSEWRVDRGEAG
jgi:hypothetical protein